jgi:hypothetical protein
MELLLLFSMLMPVLVIIGVFLLIYFIMRLLPQPVQRALNFNFTDPSANKRSQDTQPDNRLQSLQSQLLKDLSGDKARARGLLATERKSRPGMSESWYLEKIIDDLRHGRV